MTQRKGILTHSSYQIPQLLLLIALALPVAAAIVVPQTQTRGQAADDAARKVNTAMAHLSRLLGKAIQYPGVGYEALSWNLDGTAPDGSLGCPQPGQAYPKVNTRYDEINIKVDGVWYQYRISMDGATLVYLKDKVCQSQALTTCSPVVEKAIQTSSNNCSNLASESACYGNNHVEVQPANLDFSSPGARVNISNLQSLKMGSLDNANGDWGIIQMNVAPYEDPSRIINMVLFGNVDIEGVSTSGYAPMQAFTLSTGQGNFQCANIDLDGVLIQTEDNQSIRLKVEVNQVTLNLGSTVFVQSLSQELDVYSLAGSPQVTALGSSQYPRPGSFVRVPQHHNVPSGPPSAPIPYLLDQLDSLPVSLLSHPVKVPPPVTPQPIRPTLSPICTVRTQRPDGTVCIPNYGIFPCNLDHICNNGETYYTCPQDCPFPPGGGGSAGATVGGSTSGSTSGSTGSNPGTTVTCQPAGASCGGSNPGCCGPAICVNGACWVPAAN